jgi:glutamine cyclotransferase
LKARHVVIALALAAALLSCQTEQVKEWTLAAETPADTAVCGITFLDGTAWLSGGETKNSLNLYTLVDGELDLAFTMDKMISGIATDGTDLWISSTGDSLIKQVATDGTVKKSIPIPYGGNSTGLFYYDGTLWNTGFTGKIYQLDLDGNVLKTIDAPVVNLEGLVVVDDVIYALDFDNAKVIEIDMSGKKTGEIEAPFGAALALGWDGTDLWIAGQPGAGIYTYPL